MHLLLWFAYRLVSPVLFDARCAALVSVGLVSALVLLGLLRAA